MSDRHAGSVAVVTGAASGIGRATAVRLAAEGAVVIATDLTADRLEELHAIVPGVVTVAGDLVDPAFVASLVERAEEAGEVDVLANVAGVMDHFVPVGDVTDELWASVMGINLTAPMQLCRAFVPRFVERGRGAIVNVSSAAGLGGSGAGAAYHASKHGLIGLTKHIAHTYAKLGVRANAVCPGNTATGLGPSAAPWVEWAFERQLPSIMVADNQARPEQVGDVISWLASREASHVNGAVVPVDGGWKAA